MSKKKNTLKDLDEFLKQQAATLVSPEKLSEKPEPAPAPAVPVESPKETKTEVRVSKNSVSADSVADDLRELADTLGRKFKPELYDILIKTLEEQRSFSAEDKMLLNTLLYLKHGENWKAAIRDFWKEKKSSNQ